MATLSISEFSCLTEANFELAPVTVIIGPQGSGKSVTTKLFYFLADIPNLSIQAAERGDSLEEFQRLIAKQFAVWFPPSAWGPGRFNITYSANTFSIRVLRRKSKGRLRDDVSVALSEWLTNFYQEALTLFSKSHSGRNLEIETRAGVNADFERVWRVRDLLTRRLFKEVGPDYISDQTFIPAGRAFFTSIGRLVAGFEQAGSLDPVTVKFARLFANLRDRNSAHFFSAGRLPPEYIARRKRFMNSLFGGEIRFEDDSEFVLARDGRKIPFSSLSSGQQELLPMWILMDSFNELDTMRFVPPRRTRELLYIEEPEAHLFPSAQSLLMEFLIGSVASVGGRRSLVITTHSPYIMSMLNLFLKAGQLARRKKKNRAINSIVTRDCWLVESRLSALAIEDGKLRNIIDKDGLIDATYLDGISEDISRKYSKLLKIEAEI